MMFIEVFVPAGALAPDRLTELAERLGSVRELTEGEGMEPGWTAVFEELFQVVVHHPSVWVAGQRRLGPDDAPRYLVRVHLPGPWRKAVAPHVISYVTRVIAEVGAEGERPYRTPVAQVLVLGVTEGSIGLLGRPVDSAGIVALMSEPYAADLARGQAVVDPLCGVTVPLTERAVTLDWEGETLGFCCADCRTAFLTQRGGAHLTEG